MQTQILSQHLATNAGKRADEILRKCVHCGFCTATCPTYQLLGDELDGPRGRIYQVKQVLEGLPVDAETQLHLDRCLTCRSCETTCPSGVNYAELIDIGRHLLEQRDLRSSQDKRLRKLLGWLLPYRKRHRLLFKLGSLIRPLLPPALQAKAPIIRPAQTFPSHSSLEDMGTVLLLEGCVQSTLSPNTNAAATAVLQTLGYRVIRETPDACCGAVNHHLNQSQATHDWIVYNLEKWQRLNQQHPIDYIVSTASGCGVMLKDYARLLEQDEETITSWQPLLDKIRDISELLDAENLKSRLPDFDPGKQTIAFHAPCTLSHGHRLADRLAAELTKLGYQLQFPQNAHLCCGSAGTYSILQPDLSKNLRKNKLEALQQLDPDFIITANVGCEHHLNSAAETPVLHWAELIAGNIRS